MILLHLVFRDRVGTEHEFIHVFATPLEILDEEAAMGLPFHH